MSKIPHLIDKTFEHVVVIHSAEDAYGWKVSRELPSSWHDSSLLEMGPTIHSQSRVTVQPVIGCFIPRRDREILLGSMCSSSS